jgi:hypothetical protein
MTNPQQLIRQKGAFILEADIAFYTIEAGLAAIDKNRPYAPKPYYFLWFSLLSTGFERLMKLIICLHEFEQNGAFPTRRFQRQMGHNLVALRNEIVARCFTPTYCASVAGQEDYQFITSNNVINAILSAIDDFAREDRYMFMDNITDPAIGREWPKRRWEEIERFALSVPVYDHLLMHDHAERCRRANVMMKAHVEQFVRALARLFIHGNLGDLARSQFVQVMEYIRIDDADLGRKTYQL